MSVSNLREALLDKCLRYLSACLVRVGNNNFDTLDYRWLLLDLKLFGELLVTLKMYADTEGRFSEGIMDEAIQVFFANKMRVHHIFSTERSAKQNIMEMMRLSEPEFEAFKTGITDSEIKEIIGTLHTEAEKLMTIDVKHIAVENSETAGEVKLRQKKNGRPRL